MKERPILFNGDMVRAILEGRKTQIRRVIKPQPKFSENVGFIWNGSAYGLGISEGGTERNFARKCPLGQPGDRLWAREDFSQELFVCNSCPDSEYGFTGTWKNDGLIIYHADMNTNGEKKSKLSFMHKRPSFHMPRWASRITLEITEVRVQRLHDISEDDAVAEGLDFDSGWEEELGEGYTDGFGWRDYSLTEDDYFSCKSATDSFKSLWNSIYKNWNSNPWVWAISFKMV